MNTYLSDEEYDDWFFDLGGARDDLVQLLKTRGLGPGSRVLDVAAGHGTLTLKVAQAVREGEVVAVGLANDVRDYKWFRTQVPEGQFSSMVYYLEMDATHLEFEDGRFDFVVNFLGLEDIRMTSGDEGMAHALQEMARVVRPGGHVQVAIAVYGDEPDEVLLKEVESFIGHGAVFPPPEFLRDQLRENGLEMDEELLLVPGRKLTATQAKEEISFACERTPVIFQEYGVRTRGFEEVWNRFGLEIERVGLAHYSRISCIVARKPLG
ncbi:MAG: methyltransferase domain-containing protein [Thermoplasmata archaeon]|nr:methyltransferase domain-containing protein [Thermoplasmata archaeon]